MGSALAGYDFNQSKGCHLINYAVPWPSTNCAIACDQMSAHILCILYLIGLCHAFLHSLMD